MKNQVITIENYNSISTITEAARLDILSRYKVDKFDNYANVRFLIAGTEAIKKYLDETGTQISDRHEIRVKEGARVNVLPYIGVSWYFDARTNKGGWTQAFVNVFSMIEVNGVLMLGGWSNKGMFSFQLLNGGIRCNDYLPYNWEQEHPQPNKVGVLTDKKAKDWAEWLTLRNETAKAIKAERESKTADFLARVRKASKGCKDSYISDKNGWVSRGGLKFSYQIADNGNIFQEIKIDILSDLLKGDDQLAAFENMTGRA